MGKEWFVESWEEEKLTNEFPRDKRRRRRLAAMREAFTGCKDWESFFNGHIFEKMTEEEFQVKYRQVAYDLAADSLRLRPDARAFVYDIEIKSGKHLHFNPAEMIAKTLSKLHLQILFHEAIDAYTKICRARSRSRLLEGSGFIVYIFERIDEIQENVDYIASACLKGPDSFYGTKGLRKVAHDSVGKVTFQFQYASGNNNGTSVEDGQIPEIIFLYSC